MSFLKKLENQVNVLGKKSGEMLEVTKLKMARSRLEKDADEKKLELGRQVYEEYLQGNIADEDLVAMCEGIDRVNNEIKQTDEQIVAAQNKDSKGAAVAEIPKSAEVVGADEKPGITEVQESAEVVGADEAPGITEIPKSAEAMGASEGSGIIEAPKAKYCPNCGERAEVGAKFCGNCGNRME